MTFEEYFQLGDLPDEEKALRFLLGLAPVLLHFGYLVDPSRVDLANHRGPSTIMACQLCAGAAATEALKILLNRGKVRAAPHGLHFDAYRGKLARTWRPAGNGNVLQRLMLNVARRRLSTQFSPAASQMRADSYTSSSVSPASEESQSTQSATPFAEESPPQTVVEQILNLARWAPSGDNTQPWRFEIVDEHHVVVHGFDTRDHCVYDLDGHPSQMALGALLETMSIAATGHGLRAEIQRRPDSSETQPTFDIHFKADINIRPERLIPYIPYRSVQRRAMRTRPLTKLEKTALEASVGQSYNIVWLEGVRNRLRAARLMFNNAKLRLTIPEAYKVHRSIIEWNARYSEDRVPDQALKAWTR